MLTKGDPDAGAKALASGIVLSQYTESVNNFIGLPTMPHKQSSSKTSTLASKVLSGAKKPTLTEAKKLAASVLSQDEKRGQK